MSYSIEIHLNGKDVPERFFPEMSMKYSMYYALKAWLLKLKFDRRDVAMIEGARTLLFSNDYDTVFDYKQCVSILEFLKAVGFDRNAIDRVSNRYGVDYGVLFDSFYSIIKTVVDYGDKDNITVQFS